MVLNVGAKLAVNTVAPGYSSAVDFAQAAYDFRKGDVTGGALNILSGIAEICTLGLSGCVQEAIKGSANNVAAQTAKETAKEVKKEAAKETGEEIGKWVAKASLKIALPGFVFKIKLFFSRG